MKKTIYILIYILFVSCSTIIKESLDQKKSVIARPSPDVIITKGLSINIQNIQDIIPTHSLIVQHVEFKGTERLEQAQVIFKNQKTLQVIALSGFGIELFNAKFLNGGEFTYESKLNLPRELFDKIISDMLIVYSTKKQILARFSSPIVVTEAANYRQLEFNNQKLIEIYYDKGKNWDSDINFINYELGYRLKIKTTKNELLPK